MHKYPRNYEDVPLWGPNRAHHIQGYFGVGIYTPLAVTNPDFTFGRSWNFSLGVIYRYRIANFINSGFALGIASQSIALNNSGMVKSWDNQVHSKAKLFNSVLTVKPFLRFNLSPKRGDYLGTFIDVGGFGTWNFFPTAVFTDEVNGEKYIQTYQKDKEQERFHYGAFASVGRDWFRLEGSYHLSNILKDDTFEMPRYMMAIVFGF
jgi:hypothetical protein